MRAIRDGLGKMGVVVSEEALRLWFNAHKRRSPKTEARLRAATETAIAAVRAEALATAVPPPKSDSALASPVIPKPETASVTLPAAPAAPISLRPLPGETAYDAFLRRTAHLRVPRAAQGSK